MLEEFAEVAEGVAFAEPRIPLVSNLTGEPWPPSEICTAEYWVRHVREPVRFADGVRWLADRGSGASWSWGPTACSARWLASVWTGARRAGTQAITGGGERVRVRRGSRRAGRRSAPWRSRCCAAGTRRRRRCSAALGELWVHGARRRLGAAVRRSGRRAGGAAHLRLPARALLAVRGRPERGRLAAAGQARRGPSAAGRGGRAGRRRGLAVHRAALARDPSVAGRPRGAGHGAAAGHGVPGARAARRRAARLRLRARS